MRPMYIVASTLQGYRHRLAGRMPLGALTLLVAAVALAPGITQDAAYHQFADQRAWFGVPHAADVLSNLAFALVGLMGLVRLTSRRRTHFSAALEASMACIALGLVLTGAGSAWYHVDPTDASLVWDRLAMVVVFAGMLGAAMARPDIPARGWTNLALLLALGIATIACWTWTGNLAPYLAFQFGGILTLALLIATGEAAAPIPWGWVIAWYVLAKAAELADHQIWDVSRHLIAGHTLKHLLAAAAGAAALWPLLKRH